MSYIDRLNAITSQKRPQTSLTQPTQPPREMSVVSVTSVGTFSNSAEVLASWKAQLARVDPCRPRGNFGMSRWQVLNDDAAWLLVNFGSQAAHQGWSTADLFGVYPGKPHWGGLADRLRGSRSLVMTENMAAWRSFGVAETFARSSYPELQPFWHCCSALSKKH